MNLEHAILPEELVLARLTAAKLGKVMHGLMSVGAASLELDSPTDFLTGREKTPLGFLEVLSCIGVAAEYGDKVPLLRQPVRQLSSLVRQFHRQLIDLASWRSLSPEETRAAVCRVADSYTQFCEVLSEFCGMLGMDVNLRQQANQDRALLEAFFQAPLQEPAALK